MIGTKTAYLCGAMSRSVMLSQCSGFRGLHYLGRKKDLVFIENSRCCDHMQKGNKNACELKIAELSINSLLIQCSVAY